MSAGKNEIEDKRSVLSRRKFLITGTVLGGSLIVGIYFATRRDFLGDPGLLQAQDGEVALNAWLKIAPDGIVTVAVPRSEMGQGVYTSLPMLLADELGADWEKVRVEQAPIARVYANVDVMADGLPIDPDGERFFERFARWSAKKLGTGLGVQMTGGSTSVRDAWVPMRLAGAVAREMLITAGASQWGVERRECAVQDGHVVHEGSGRRLGFGELAADAAQVSPPSPWPALKSPNDFTLIGKPLPRLDVQDKTDGSAGFGIDVRLPDMLYATVRLSPVFGGTVRSFDEGVIKDMPGVYKVVEVDRKNVV